MIGNEFILNKMILKRYLFLIILIYTSSCSTIFAQHSICNIDKIPVSSKIYFLGQVHLDYYFYPDSNKNFSRIDSANYFESAIRKYLITKCNVKYTVIEAPVWIEYYYKKYAETGNEYFLAFLPKKSQNRNQLRCI